MEFTLETENNRCMEEIQNAQNNYYQNNAKHTFFKNKQKLDCSQHVANNVDLQKMLACTAFIVPNTNIIYYNYMVFKTYGNEVTHVPLYQHVNHLVQTIFETYDTFEFHINLKTFTVSACQRYYNLIVSSIDDNKVFTDKMTKLVVYNTPALIDQVTRLLSKSIKDILPKVEYFHKESDEKIKILFNL